MIVEAATSVEAAREDRLVWEAPMLDDLGSADLVAFIPGSGFDNIVSLS